MELRLTGSCMVRVSLAKRVRHFTQITFHLSKKIRLFQFSAKTIEIDALRFQDKDLNVIGTLEYGQFGVVCLFVSIYTLFF